MNEKFCDNTTNPEYEREREREVNSARKFVIPVTKLLRVIPAKAGIQIFKSAAVLLRAGCCCC